MLGAPIRYLLLTNDLPLHIRSEDNFERFKSLLKTHLFRLASDLESF